MHGIRDSNRDITRRKTIEIQLKKANSEIKTLKTQLLADQTYLREEIKQEFKMHMPLLGLPGAAAPTFNLYRDPREEHPMICIVLWSVASFQDMAARH